MIFLNAVYYAVSMLVEICHTSKLIPVLISVMTCTLLNVARLLLVFTTECNFKNFTTVSGQSMKDKYPLVDILLTQTINNNRTTKVLCLLYTGELVL